MEQLKTCSCCEQQEVAEFNCSWCGDSVCYDCCEPYTQFNLLEDTVCKICYGTHEREKADHYQRKEKEAEAAILRNKEIQMKRFVTSRKPENIEKRRLKKESKRALRREQLLAYLKRRSELLAEIFGDFRL